ncbi:HAD family hydrolase [Candidatus Uhrbacteria bacterium]|nr:HAD family hydrolase [Candidatus Uhrbacteria bacterium]
MKIKHVWFDLEGTLTVRSEEFNKAHDSLRYSAYASATKQEVSNDLQVEYETLYSQYGSNSATFRSLGLPSDYWQNQFAALDVEKYYRPVPEITETLDQLRGVVPISMFTNLKHDEIDRILEIIGINKEWFTSIISGDDVLERKPSLNGFKKMVEVCNLEPQQLMYVGDRIKVDILPARELGIKTYLVFSESDQADFSSMHFKDILTLFVDPK